MEIYKEEKRRIKIQKKKVETLWKEGELRCNWVQKVVLEGNQ